MTHWLLYKEVGCFTHLCPRVCSDTREVEFDSQQVYTSHNCFTTPSSSFMKSYWVTFTMIIILCGIFPFRNIFSQTMLYVIPLPCTTVYCRDYLPIPVPVPVPNPKPKTQNPKPEITAVYCQDYLPFPNPKPETLNQRLPLSIAEVTSPSLALNMRLLVSIAEITSPSLPPLP